MSFNRSRYNRKSFRASPHRSSYGARSDYNPRYQRHHRAERRGHYEDRSYDYAPQRYSSPHHSRRYSKYHYPQPSGEVFIEEPETESEVDSESEYDGLAPSEDDERTYDFDLESNDDDSASEVYYDSDGFPEGEYEEIFVIPEDFDGDDVFIEIDSDFYDSEDDAEDDIVVDEDISSESSDDEGITIYKHRFDLPDRYDSDNDSTDPELEFSDDELLLQANDSDDEFDVIDLSKELKDSKECEVVELDDNTYKLNLRLPSLIKEDLKINFLKNENELVINGKFVFDKVVKFDEIKASFLENGELELIIPNEGVEIDAAENNVAISIEGQPQSQRAIDTEQAEVEAVAEAVAEAATADVEMAT
ncbi:hypothetical protein HF325_005518 [Metschnikowia pulcherrima]|uniref:SHSP domain-containing protein n=1 Tax=Metschnikowia pulcherrima TaxID=27326 RepID=A0A8H7L938_9ASCO|nr:hypothetical protein HF325_005518 [Metschnikowia pulcherrima]